MTRRATFTQAELARAIAAAEQTGKVAMVTPEAILFLDPAAVPVPTLARPQPPEVSGLDVVRMTR
jgi:hypothetical protein